MKGCSREQLGGFSFGGEELGKFLSVGDGQNSNPPEKADAVLCARHGKEYVMLINNKRCIRPCFWRRGSLWGMGGSWLLEGSQHMQEHIKDILSQQQPNAKSERTTPVLETEQLQPNWRKCLRWRAPSLPITRR